MSKSFDSSYVKWSIGFLAVIIFQITVLQYISINVSQDIRVKPDLVLLLIFFFGLRFSQIHSTFTGFAGGLVLDILSGGIIGLNALTKTISGFITGYMPREYKIKQLSQFCLFLFSICIIHDVIFNIIYVINSQLSFWRIFLLYSLPSSVYTVFIGGIIYYWNKK
ncbi:MAG: rod shape-determining protein MreD [bacterium]|nr:rod shape-determining protein MreD [bacterium]